VSSDHFFPWLDTQGHAPYAWTLLGAVAQATSRVDLMTYVTCPSVRYHPAVVAQKAGTLGVLSDGRFTLGLGAGENLNEHVVGERWPAVGERHDLLAEAIEIVRRLLTGDDVSWEGEHFQVDSARVWDLPDDPVEIAVAVSGDVSVERFAPLADHLVATEPDGDLVSSWNDERAGLGLEPTRAIGQIPICWDTDRDRAVARAHDQFRWFGLGWPVNSNLPTTEAFRSASAFVRPDDIAGSIPCGPDLDAIVEAVSAYWQAGFTDVALVQIGDEGQQEFLDRAAGPLLEKLRKASS
jgi:G6PDH family F420-dependent oxidoreductase